MSIKDLLAKLQFEYLASFPEKMALIRQLWHDKRIEDLRNEYHKLKGTGRTYGIPEVSQIGEAIETLCESDVEALQTALPLSLKLFERVRVRRAEPGRPPLILDEDRDFQCIVELVVASNARPTRKIG